jgi:hypothetical protein
MEINLLTYCICMSIVNIVDRHSRISAKVCLYCTVLEVYCGLEAVVDFRLDPLYYSISGRRPFERGCPVAASLPVGEKTGAGIF